MISTTEPPLSPMMDAPMLPLTEAPPLPPASAPIVPAPQPMKNATRSPASPGGPTVREQITSMATRHIAAAIIAAPDFPSRSRLPKLLPPPFSNFEHQVLFDYQMLVQIVWQVATDIVTCLRAKRRTWHYWLMGVLIAVGVLLAFTAHLVLTLVYFPVAGIAILMVLGFTWNDQSPSIAKIRVEALQALIRDEFVIRDDMPLVSSHLIGNGELGTERVPVVTVVDDSEPFSGYGRLQADNLFVCRPKYDEAGRRSMAEIEERIHERVTAKVRELNLPETAFGTVIVLHGESLAMDSPWLDRSKAPRLWLPRDRLPDVHAIDPRASVRVYFATQIVFPQHMTAATFFVRLFPAGNGAAFQIAVTTIGPPAIGLDELTMRLFKHDMEELRRAGGDEDIVRSGRKPAEREGLDYLAILRDLSALTPPFQNSNPDEKSITELDAHGEQDRGAEYDRRLRQFTLRCRMWPGHLTGKDVNWREAHSLTFPADFFGRPELIASVLTVYDQLARGILDMLDEMGFDISDHRDSEGRYAIHAEKIEQLVVGERVHMNSKKGSKKGSKTAPEQASKGGNDSQKAAA
jgi:hypothetical protein